MKGSVNKKKAEANAALATERRAQQEELTAKAKEEEQKRQTEELARQKAQAELGNYAVAPEIKSKWAAAHKVEGRKDEIILADGTSVKGRYVLVESGAATASHNVRNEFAPTEGFPIDDNGQNVNDRDYQHDADAQAYTRNAAAGYDARALQTPVVVSKDGIVLSGNGRTMAGEIAAEIGTDGKYIEYLKGNADKYGFTPEQVAGMEHPRVEFVPDEDMPYTAETFAKFNQQEMKGQSKAEQAVKLSKIVDDSTFKRITDEIASHEKLGDLYADTEASGRIIGELRKAGVISEAQMAEMFDGEQISQAGKEMIENVLIGKAFEDNPDAVRMITTYKGMRQSVVTALSEIAGNVSLGTDYLITDSLSEAIKLVYEARKSGYKTGDRVSMFARQGNLFDFDEGATVADMNNIVALQIADLLNSNKSTALKNYFKNYNAAAKESAAGQLDIFAGGVLTKEDIIKDALKTIDYGKENEQEGNGSGKETGIVNGRNEGKSDARRSDLAKEKVGTDKYGYTEQDYLDEASLNEQYADELNELSAIEDDDEFEEAAKVLEGKLPSGFGVSVDQNNVCSITLTEPTVYYNIDGTRRHFKIGETIQIAYEGRNPHIIVTRIDENGKVVEAIDMLDGRLIVENGKKRSIEDVLNEPKRISEERDQNGSNFMIADDGSLDFGQITADKNLTPAPIRMSLGDAENGYIHIETRHGEQIRKNGFKNVFDFIEHVLKNYNLIKKGDAYDNSKGGKNQTYYVQLTDGHNNTVFIQLSRDDSYWNINSAGIFSKRYGRNKENVWSASEVQNSGSATTSDALQSEPNADNGSTSNGTASNASLDNPVPAVGSSASTDATGINHGTTKGAAITSGNSPIDSQGKGSNNSATEQAQAYETDIFSQNEAETESADGNSSPVATAIAAAEAETDTNPSEAQKKAGNYKKGHVKVNGYDITIENPKGSVRSGKDADGKEWSVTMNNTYGYIRGTEGVDGDHIDVFLSDNPEQGNVYVVDQVDADGNFDEHKVMYGFGSAEEARDNYLANYSEGWKMGTITEVSKDEFKKWIESSHRKTKPFSEYKSVKKEGAQGEAQQPSTAAEEKETNVDKAIRIMKEIDDLSSELDELYTTGPEAEADRVSAEHMAKYGELEALEKSMTDEEKKALDKRLRNDEDDLDGEWAEWLEAGMKEEPVESTHSLNNAEAEKNQKPEKPQKTSQRKPRKTKPSATTAGDERINDVGEKIGGARKDATLNYAKKIDLEATTPSKIFPKPNFASMEKAGVPHETLVKLKAYYTAFSITNKNKRKRNENQRILSARFYASIARDMLLRDVDVFNESAEGIVLTDYGKQHLELLMACVEALDKKGMEDFFDLDISDVNVNIGEFKEHENGAYESKDGKRWVGSYSPGRTNNMAVVGRKVFALDDIEGLAEEYCKQVEEAHNKSVQDEIKIHVYRIYTTNTLYISAKVKGISDEIKLKDGFTSSKEAFDYVRENADALRTEARAKADEMKQSKKNGGGTRKPTNDDIERMLRNIVQGTRIGKDYRNGKDVSAEDFMKEFGFRGVEFGNWATQKERQDHLNACYDALMDLADLVGISPKAVSLGGKLAMAFGSRGHSSALAHYEPAKHVINLTKEHGAGCVAHEWFHAVDNYFGGGVFGLRMKSAVEGNSRDNLRSEMQKIFAEIGRALNSSDMKVRSKKLGNGDYWASTLEMAARAFESYVNERLMERGQKNQYLSAHVPGEAVQYEELAKNDPYPTAEESKKFGEIFDHLFDTVQEEVGDDGNVNLFQIADVEPYTENNTEAEQLATEAVMTLLNETAGLDVVMNTQEEGQREAMRGTSEMMANERFNNELNDFKSKSHVGLLHLGNPGAKLRACGVNAEELTLSPTVLNRHLRQHGLTEDDLVDLVNLINDPILVYKHGQNNPNIVVVTEKTVNGGKLSISVELDENGNVVEIDNVRSVHSKEATKELTRLSDLTEDELRDNVRWVENEKVLDWLFGVGLDRRMPEEGSELFAVAKVLKNHENPIIEDEKSANTAEFMQVWHGSSAIFDQFDGAFMGTGEGSQVYGVGHYVTGVESTGRMYATIATENRQRSNTPIVRWKGQQVDFSSVNPLRLAHDVADSSRTIKEARDRAERYADMAEEDDMKTNWKLALDILKQSTKADFKPVPVNGNRQLYEVEIPDDNGSNYLDWNITIKKSDRRRLADTVRNWSSDRLDTEHFGYKYKEGFDTLANVIENNQYAAQEILERLTQALKGGRKEASRLLSAAGFVGIKVPTGNRRGGDGRGMNYVIFNDGDLKITDRVQFMQRPEGTVYGWSEGNRIHLTPEGINPNTPIHEYTHLWSKAVMTKAPKLWNNVKELMKRKVLSVVLL